LDVTSLVDRGYEYSVDLLKKLIEIPSVSPSGENYDKISDLLYKELSRIADSAEVIEVPKSYQSRNCKSAGENPRYIVLGRVKGLSGKRIHFNGHYDVVPGGQGWTVTDPFKPVIKDGRLYGRGAIDMKGGIAAVMGAVYAVHESGSQPYHDIELAFVPDEEIGGECGTGYLVEELLAGNLPDYVIIPEPSGLNYPWHGHKGLLWAKVKVKGVNAHGSTPWRGKNAFLLGARLSLELLSAYAPILSRKRSKYKTIPEESMHPTIMIGGEAGVSGGGKTNQVPGEFYFTIDRRLIPEETVDEVKKELEAVLRWVGHGLGLDYTVEYTAMMEPAINEPGELYRALVKAASIHGVSVSEPIVCPGGLDLRYYTSKGVKTLSYGPGGEVAHAPDEYISLDELKKLVGIFYTMVSDKTVWD